MSFKRCTNYAMAVYAMDCGEDEVASWKRRTFKGLVVTEVYRISIILEALCGKTVRARSWP